MPFCRFCHALAQIETSKAKMHSCAEYADSDNPMHAQGLIMASSACKPRGCHSQTDNEYQTCFTDSTDLHSLVWLFKINKENIPHIGFHVFIQKHVFVCVCVCVCVCVAGVGGVGVADLSYSVFTPNIWKDMPEETVNIQRSNSAIQSDGLLQFLR